MGWLNRSAAAVWNLGRAPAAIRARSIEEIADILDAGGFGVASKAGARVTVDTALQVTTVLACVRVIAEGIAQLPLKVYRDGMDGGKDPARDHWSYRLLAKRPNEWMTSFEFREAMTLHAALAGNGYAIKNVTGDGAVGELLPVMPQCVQVEQLRNYDIVYRVTIDGREVGVFSRERMFHLKGPTWSTVAGMVPARLARESIGLAMAAEESQSRFFSNGTRLGGILSTEENLSDEQLHRIADAWKQVHAGVDNAFKTAVLDGGIKFHQMTSTATDAQTIETRKHQIEEIARAFRVFPQMIGYADKTATYASAEQFFLAHVIHSLGPWIARWEATLDRDILGGAEDLFSKFSVEGLLRGAAKDRAEFYNKMVTMGAFTRNEVRRLEDLDPLPGLDEPLTPLNMDTGRGDQSDATEGE